MSSCKVESGKDVINSSILYKIYQLYLKFLQRHGRGNDEKQLCTWGMFVVCKFLSTNAAKDSVLDINVLAAAGLRIASDILQNYRYTIYQYEFNFDDANLQKMVDTIYRDLKTSRFVIPLWKNNTNYTESPSFIVFENAF